MQKDYNGCNYHTFKAKTLSSLIRVLKSKKKKLALTSFYCLSQAAGLDDSWKLINIDQLRFYNVLAFSTKSRLQAESPIWQEIFLHAILFLL